MQEVKREDYQPFNHHRITMEDQEGRMTLNANSFLVALRPLNGNFPYSVDRQLQTE